MTKNAKGLYEVDDAKELEALVPQCIGKVGYYTNMVNNFVLACYNINTNLGELDPIVYATGCQHVDQSLDWIPKQEKRRPEKIEPLASYTAQDQHFRSTSKIP